jgi:hypothetical protein
MTEERKHAILFATTLLCARKIIDLVDSPTTKRWASATGSSCSRKKRIDHVAALMEKIDERWPTGS